MRLLYLGVVFLKLNDVCILDKNVRMVRDICVFELFFMMVDDFFCFGYKFWLYGYDIVID